MTAKSKFPLLFTLGTAALLIGGGAGAYWFLTRQGDLPEALPFGANVVPQEALLTVSLSTDTAQWDQLRTFGNTETQTRLDENLAQIRDELLADNGLDYQQDVQPWIGEEITIAILPQADAAGSETTEETPAPDEPALDEPAADNSETSDTAEAEGSEAEETTPEASEETETDAAESTEEKTGSESAEEAGAASSPETATDDDQSILVVLPIEKPLEAKNILEGKAESAFEETAVRKYKGVEVREVKNGEEDYAIAALDTRFLVITTELNAIDQAIDTYKGSPSTVATPGYRQAFSQVDHDESFAKLFINIPAASALASESGAVNPSQSLAQLQDSQGLAATIVLEPSGIRLRGTSWLQPDSAYKHDPKNNAKRLPDRLPAETLMMVSGGNLQKLWQDYVRGAGDSPNSPFDPQSFRSGFQTATGLDLEDDLLGWMGGEFALSIVPVSNPESSATSVGVLFMAQASDRSAAEDALKNLDAVAANRFRFKVEESQLGEQAITNWTTPFAALTVTRGWLNNDIVFLTVGQDAPTSFLPKPQQSLADSPKFQALTTSDLNPNNGHFFIDVEKVLDPASNIPLPTLPPEQQTFAEAIQAIGVTAAIQDAQSTRYDIYVSLETGDAPGPLPDLSAPSADPAPASPDGANGEPSEEEEGGEAAEG